MSRANLKIMGRANAKMIGREDKEWDRKIKHGAGKYKNDGTGR